MRLDWPLLTNGSVLVAKAEIPLCQGIHLQVFILTICLQAHVTMELLATSLSHLQCLGAFIKYLGILTVQRLHNKTVPLTVYFGTVFQW